MPEIIYFYVLQEYFSIFLVFLFKRLNCDQKIAVEMTRITTHPALKTCELWLVNFVFELGLQLGSMVLFHLAAQCFKEQWDLTVFVAIITTIH